MSSRFSLLQSLSFVAAVVIAIGGCDNPPPTPSDPAKPVVTSQQDHGDHEHSDHAEHEHGDHEHGDHEHAEHEHSDHDHGDHEHADHDHGEHEHDDHEHGDHSHEFTSLEPAVKELESLGTHIGEAFTRGKTEDAHDDLHHVGEVLEAIEKIVKEKLTGDSQQKAAAAVEKLFDAYTAIDGPLHGKSGKEYSEVKETISEAMKTLKSVVH